MHAIAAECRAPGLYGRGAGTYEGAVGIETETCRTVAWFG